MKRVWIVVLVACCMLAVGCKKKEEAKPAPKGEKGATTSEKAGSTTEAGSETKSTAPKPGMTKDAKLEAQAEKITKDFEKMTDVMATATDEASSKKALAEMDKLAVQMGKEIQEGKDMGELPPDMKKKFEPRMKAAMTKMQAEMGRIMKQPWGMQFMKDYGDIMKKMQPAEKKAEKELED